MRIHVTKHARDRFLQRYSLFLTQKEIESPAAKIIQMIETGYKTIQLENCPFYKNKLGCSTVVNGKVTFYLKDNVVVTCVVKTGREIENWRH